VANGAWHSRTDLGHAKSHAEPESSGYRHRPSNSSQPLKFSVDPRPADTPVNSGVSEGHSMTEVSRTVVTRRPTLRGAGRDSESLPVGVSLARRSGRHLNSGSQEFQLSRTWAVRRHWGPGVDAIVVPRPALGVSSEIWCDLNPLANDTSHLRMPTPIRQWCLLFTNAKPIRECKTTIGKCPIGECLSRLPDHSASTAHWLTEKAISDASTMFGWFSRSLPRRVAVPLCGLPQPQSRMHAPI
jgi:hypothetical protein